MSVLQSSAAFGDHPLVNDEARTLPGSPACRHALNRLVAVSAERTGPPRRQAINGQADQNADRWSRTATALATGAKRSIMALAVLGVLWFVAMVVLILAYRFVNPPASSLMLIRSVQGQPIKQSWVPLKSISPNLVKAVIASEDSRFCAHNGIDIGEIRRAIARAKDGAPRGGSTMTMQLAKNLFLWPDRSYIRKVLEAPLTLMIEVAWPKWRIAEIYLNVVEWGPGIYGAQAAAVHHFGRPASRLSSRQAALLAVSLPSPAKRNPGKPGRLTKKLSNRIVARSKSLSQASANCVLAHTKSAR
ncbi:MAG: monofunctional biosynthetic peptidoglycan transglycosylase [Pseudomonadota bacterium]